MPTRREVLAALAGLALTGPAAAVPAPARPLVTVHKDPSCGCCGAWVAHIEKAGYRVAVIETERMNPLKAEKGVPKALWSCHTAMVDGYVLEGHVPAAEIDRLLATRPAALGLAVPGMPVGSPGMEVDGAPPDSYDVVLFGRDTPRPFARYRGRDLVAR